MRNCLRDSDFGLAADQDLRRLARQPAAVPRWLLQGLWRGQYSRRVEGGGPAFNLRRYCFYRLCAGISALADATIFGNLAHIMATTFCAAVPGLFLKFSKINNLRRSSALAQPLR
jgi:hypothetical protein